MNKQQQELDYRVKRAHIDGNGVRVIEEVDLLGASISEQDYIRMMHRPVRGEKKKNQGWLKRV